MNDKRDYTKVPGERDPRPAVVPKPTCLRIEPMQCVDFKPDDEENEGWITIRGSNLGKGKINDILEVTIYGVSPV